MELFGEEEKGRGIEKRRREVRLLFQRRSILLSLINGEKKKKNLISITGGAVSMYGVESEVATCRAGMTVRSRLWEEPWREFLGRCLFRDKDPGPAVFGYLLPY